TDAGAAPGGPRLALLATTPGAGEARHAVRHVDVELASLSSGRPASAFFTARSTDASCAFTASCFDGATTRSWFTCICYMALYALQDAVEQRGVAGGGARGRSGQLLVGALGPTRVRDLLDGGDRLVLVQLVVERLQADPERLGRLLLVAALLVQGGEYEPALRFGERATDPELDHPARHRSLGLRPVRELRAQERNVPGLDLLVGEDEGAVQGMLELAHVARPLVPLQEL